MEEWDFVEDREVACKEKGSGVVGDDGQEESLMFSCDLWPDN